MSGHHAPSGSSSSHSLIQLAPATQRVVTTTTTTTTIHYSPLKLPRVEDLPPLALGGSSFPERQAGGAVKRHPLAALPVPEDIRSYRMRLGSLEGAFFDDAADMQVDKDGSAKGVKGQDKGKKKSLEGQETALGPGPQHSRSAMAGKDRHIGGSGRHSSRTRHPGRSTAAGGAQQPHTVTTVDDAEEDCATAMLRSPGPPRKRQRNHSDHEPLALHAQSRFACQALPSPVLSPGPAASGRLVSPVSQHSLLPATTTSASNAGTTTFRTMSPVSSMFSPASPAQTDDENSSDDPADHDPRTASGVPSTSVVARQAQSFAARTPSPDELAAPKLDLGNGVDLSALFSLPTLAQNFAHISPSVQSYIIYTLLRQSPVQVLQTVNSFIQPALKRDFLADLPTELSLVILSFLDGPDLCRASRVSKDWRRLVDGERKVWQHRLIAEGFWVGHGVDEREAKKCEAEAKGGPKIDKDKEFTRRWLSGVWDEQYDACEAARPTAEKLALARRPRRQLRSTPFPYPAESSSQARARQTLGAQGPTETMVGKTLARDANEHYVHPYKLLYRKRYVTQRNWTQREPKRFPYAGHGNSVVTCLQFDREKFVSASDDHSINVYSTRSGELLKNLEGHEGGVWALQYVGNTLVSGSTDRTVRIWDMTTGRCTHAFSGHTSTVRCLQIIEPQNVNPDPDGEPVWEPPYPLIVTGSRDSTLRVWKLPLPGSDLTLDKENEVEVRGDYDYANAPWTTPSAGGSTSNVSHTADAGIAYEDALEPSNNPYHLHALEGHKHAVRALACHGRMVVSGSYDFTVRVWDVLTGECTYVLEGHSQKVYSIVLDPIRQTCASGSMDGTIRLWSTDDGTCLRILEGHSSLVGLLSMSQKHLVSAAADSTLRIWDADTGMEKSALQGHTGAITCFAHDEFKVISGSDGTLKLWDARDGSFVRDLMNGLTGVWQVEFDERFCIAAVQRNGVSEFEVLDFGSGSGDDEMSPPISPPSPPSTLMLADSSSDDTGERGREPYQSRGLHSLAAPSHSHQWGGPSGPTEYAHPSAASGSGVYQSVDNVDEEMDTDEAQ